MTHIDTCQALFARHGLDFAQALERNYRDGFVFSTPSYFVMGRPILDNPMAPGGAWFLESASGDTSAMWSILPWFLPWIGWERFDSRLRFYPMDDIRRFTRNEIHEQVATD